MGSAFNQINQVQIRTPRSLAITGSTPAVLQAAIDIQTNVLNKTMRIPVLLNNASGSTYASGNVLNESVVVTQTIAVVINNVLSYMATVLWVEYVIPS